MGSLKAKSFMLAILILFGMNIQAQGYSEIQQAFSDSYTLEYSGEYSKAQVLKHTITHELGHAVGMLHSPDNTCVMYEYSIDWKRDGKFSTEALNQMSVHSN